MDKGKVSLAALDLPVPSTTSDTVDYNNIFSAPQTVVWPSGPAVGRFGSYLHHCTQSLRINQLSSMRSLSLRLSTRVKYSLFSPEVLHLIKCSALVFRYAVTSLFTNPVYFCIFCCAVCSLWLFEALHIYIIHWLGHCFKKASLSADNSLPRHTLGLP